MNTGKQDAGAVEEAEIFEFNGNRRRMEVAKAFHDTAVLVEAGVSEKL